MEELKDFFVRNGATKIKNRLHLDIDNDYEIILEYKDITILDNAVDNEIMVVEPTLDRLKSLIYGLTGKQLE